MKKSNSNSKKMVIGLLATVGTLVLLLIVASVIEASDFSFSRDREDQNQNQNQSQSVFNYVDVEDMQAILDDTSGQNFFVYIGRPTCPACQQYEPSLRLLLQDLGQELRYFELDRAREILQELDEAEVNADGADAVTLVNQRIGVTSVPHMVLIRNGEVVDSADGVWLLGNAQENTLEFFERNGGLN